MTQRQSWNTNMLESMRSITKWDVLRWHFAGIAMSTGAAICVALLKLNLPSDSNYFDNVLSTAAAVATVSICSTPISVPILLLWSRVSRTIPFIEQIAGVRLVGLAILGGSFAMTVGLVVVTLGSSDRAVTTIWHKYMLNADMALD